MPPDFGAISHLSSDSLSDGMIVFPNLAPDGVGGREESWMLVQLGHFRDFDATVDDGVDREKASLRHLSRRGDPRL